MFNLDRLGSYITDLRTRAGLTQRQVADKLSISPQAVSHWERGDTFPTVDILTQLASLYSARPGRTGRFCRAVRPRGEDHPRDRAGFARSDRIAHP